MSKILYGFLNFIHILASKILFIERYFERCELCVRKRREERKKGERGAIQDRTQPSLVRKSSRYFINLPSSGKI